ncbi:MAG: site-specific DNA-methyltransferase [Thaumarchaeota archaeon S13]|nr:MAG: site-specific DNA-methyltransferase [Thaumarchaeota archaeon S13]
MGIRVSPKGRYYSSSRCGKIEVGDVLDRLRAHRNGSFDGAIADPPYNIGKDFGTSGDRMPQERYVEWSLEWIAELLRVTKRGAPTYVYGFSEILARISSRLPLGRQRWLVWHYTNKTVPSLRFWQRSHESILCVWSSARPRIASLDELREPYTEAYASGCAGKPRAGTAGRYARRGAQTTYNAHPNGALPRDVIKSPALAGGAGMRERWFLCRTCSRVCPPQALHAHAGHDVAKHPTQKPLALARRLILSMTRPGRGRIVVPFLGSGSECVAAKRLGVRFAGIEANPEYAALATGWLMQE